MSTHLLSLKSICYYLLICVEINSSKTVHNASHICFLNKCFLPEYSSPQPFIRKIRRRKEDFPADQRSFCFSSIILKAWATPSLRCLSILIFKKPVTPIGTKSVLLYAEATPFEFCQHSLPSCFNWPLSKMWSLWFTFSGVPCYFTFPFVNP